MALPAGVQKHRRSPRSATLTGCGEGVCAALSLLRVTGDRQAAAPLLREKTMQARISVSVLVIMVTAVTAGQRENLGAFAARSDSGAAARPVAPAVIYRADEAREDFRHVCDILDEGFVRPAAMDSLLAAQKPRFSRNVLQHIRSRTAFLSELGASQRSYCDDMPDALRPAQCYSRHPAAFMAQVLESFAMAIEGRRWADTPFGSADLERWQRAGGRSRPGELMMHRCRTTLAM